MNEPKNLYILWTNADVIASQLMLMMYSRNSMLNHWWDNVTVIIWGATVKLISENETIQEHYKMARHAGVKFSACISCAEQLGVVEKLHELEIEAIPWGEPLTAIIQNGEKLITI